DGPRRLEPDDEPGAVLGLQLGAAAATTRADADANEREAPHTSGIAPVCDAVKPYARTSELPVGNVPRDVTLVQRDDRRFLEFAVLPSEAAELALVLGGDVDLERAIAVEIREMERGLVGRG